MKKIKFIGIYTEANLPKPFVTVGNPRWKRDWSESTYSESAWVRIDIDYH